MRTIEHAAKHPRATEQLSRGFRAEELHWGARNDSVADRASSFPWASFPLLQRPPRQQVRADGAAVVKIISDSTLNALGFRW